MNVPEKKLLVELLRHRYNTVIEELELDDADITEASYTPPMLTCRRVLKSQSVEESSEKVAYDALSLFITPFKRVLVEALIISGAVPKDVETVFGVSEEVYIEYQHMFFDLNRIPTHLDKLYYLEELPIGNEREIKMRALNLGPEFLYFRYANIIPKNASAKEVMTRMFHSAAYRVMEANYNTIDSDISKVALQWANTMNKCFEALSKMPTDNKKAKDDIVKILSSGGSYTMGADIKPKILNTVRGSSTEIDRNNII